MVILKVWVRSVTKQIEICLFSIGVQSVFISSSGYSSCAFQKTDNVSWLPNRPIWSMIDRCTPPACQYALKSIWLREFRVYSQVNWSCNLFGAVLLTQISVPFWMYKSCDVCPRKSVKEIKKRKPLPSPTSWLAKVGSSNPQKLSGTNVW